MKKKLLTLAIALVNYGSYAQTNTFPASGSVGIGTTSPIGMFNTVAGETTDPQSQSGLRIDNKAANSTVALLAGVYSSGNAGYIQTVQPDVSWVSRSLAIQPMGGNVGIGTTSPQNKFVVSNNGAGGLEINPSLSYLGANGTWLTTYDRRLLAYQDIIFDVSGVAATNVVVKATTGNVGIGTTTPDAKLAVNGTIHSKEVKVDITGWPDYVFRPSYKLPSLFEVKTYIDQNRHLPDMPSEQEVAKRGINLGDIVKVQTKKIEELTLYLIDKDKQVSALQDQVSKQDARVTSLEAALAKLTANK